MRHEALESRSVVAGRATGTRTWWRRPYEVFAIVGVLLAVGWVSQRFSQQETEHRPIRIVLTHRPIASDAIASDAIASHASTPPQSDPSTLTRPSWQRPLTKDLDVQQTPAAAVTSVHDELAFRRCAGLLAADACRTWYATRELSAAPISSYVVGVRRRACVADCHGHGVCDEQTGVCACEAGFNGSACERANVRGCNGPTDGLWHASHCAGECDERRGYCFCPGRINRRPMSDTCQVKYMPVDAFAALGLKPDPAWIRFALNGSRLDLGVGKGSGLDRSQEVLRRRRFDDDLAGRTAALRANPMERSRVLRRFWFATMTIV